MCTQTGAPKPHRQCGADLDGGLGQVVWVPQLGGDVETEVWGVLYGGVSQPDTDTAPLFEGLLEQQRLQDGVQLLPNIFQQDCEHSTERQREKQETEISTGWRPSIALMHNI